MKIMIDPGHRNNSLDFGACGNGLKESALALQIAKKVQDKLIKNGINAILTRPNEDTTISLNDRCRKSNTYNADIFVSIHINSAENKLAEGVEVLFLSNYNLADDVCSAICKCTGAINRGAKKRTDLHVLNNVECKAILVECGFISNPDEAKLLSSEAYQDKIVHGIIDGLGVVDMEIKKTRIKVNGVIKEVDSVTVDGNNFIKLRDLSDSFIKVEYDSVKKLPVIECRA